MTRYDQDAMRRPHGARHPLAALPQSMLDAAERGIRQTADAVEPDDRDDVIEAILIELRAGGHLNNARLFTASPTTYEVDPQGLGDPKSGKVLDLHDWPHSEDITEMLFGETSIPWAKAQWAANQLNTDYAITPQAWRKHLEKIKGDAS